MGKEKRQDWLLVAQKILHISEAKEHEITWWCVDVRCNVGDRAFLYKTKNGIVCFFEICQFLDNESFCKSYNMKTAEVRIIKIFNPYISIKKLRSIPTILSESFISTNFRRKSFRIYSETVTDLIISLEPVNCQS